MICGDDVDRDGNDDDGLGMTMICGDDVDRDGNDGVMCGDDRRLE